MSLRTTLPMLALLGLPAPARADDVPALLQAKAVRLLNAITQGDPAIWIRSLDERARIVDEMGVVSDKRTMLATIRPLPAGVSGVLVTEVEATVYGDTAVTTYIADEQETFHGAKLHARYRISETWMKREGSWKLVASQVTALRSDPPALPMTAEQRRPYCGRYALGDLILRRSVWNGRPDRWTGRSPCEAAAPRVAGRVLRPRRAADAPHLPARCSRPHHRLCGTTGILGHRLETPALTAAGGVTPPCYLGRAGEA